VSPGKKDVDSNLEPEAASKLLPIRPFDPFEFRGSTEKTLKI
jgi:hypothetical protein